jgi:hypothetical protein
MGYPIKYDGEAREEPSSMKLMESQSFEPDRAKLLSSARTHASRGESGYQQGACMPFFKYEPRFHMDQSIGRINSALLGELHTSKHRFAISCILGRR